LKLALPDLVLDFEAQGLI